MYLVYSLITLLSLRSALADRDPYYRDDKFDNGDYGEYVTQSFRSNPNVQTPILNINKPFTNCDDGSYLFIAPRGYQAAATPMILDLSGSPVWAATREYGQVYNLQVQYYKGESFLTFWAGDDAVGGHGAGQYHMLDKHYNERFKISAANGLDADLHTFQLTNSDTALSSIYAKKKVSLTSLDQDEEHGWIWDSIFQELDLETGEALFEWRATDHFDLTDSFAEKNELTEDDPWDAWHINSVQKDKSGNYLISFRYLRSIIYIDGRNGEVLWRLGGARNSFFDLSDGDATTFVGQHDAHISDDGRYITLFDNRADVFYALGDPSRGKRMELDFTEPMHLTARLDAIFTHPSDILSFSQGSYQTLPNGHVLIGYGFNGAVTEYSGDGGEPLCDVRFEPATGYGSGNVQSYRNLKFNWTGLPDTDPDLVLDGESLLISWNGATEVRHWIFQDCDLDNFSKGEQDFDSAFEDFLRIAKTGFETEMPTIASMAFRRFVRAIGIDEEGNRLGKSRIIDIGDLATYSEGESTGDMIEFADGEFDEQDIVEAAPLHSEHSEMVTIKIDGETMEVNKDRLSSILKGEAFESADRRNLEFYFLLGVLVALVVLTVIVGPGPGSRRTRRPSEGTSEERRWYAGKLVSRVSRITGVFDRLGRRSSAEIAATRGLLSDVEKAELGEEQREM